MKADARDLDALGHDRHFYAQAAHAFERAAAIGGGGVVRDFAGTFGERS